MESLLTILGLILLSAVSSWLKRKSQQGEAEAWPEAGPPPPLTPGQRPRGENHPKPGEERPRPSRMNDWEAELRRLLQGEEEESPRPAPPVIIKPTSPPPRAPSPPPVPPPRRPPVRVQTKPVAVERRPEVDEEGGSDESPGRLAGALNKWRDARNLQDTVGNQMQTVAALRHRKSLPSQTTQLGLPIPHIGQVLRSKPDVRQAVVASIILGPPKALE